MEDKRSAFDKFHRKTSARSDTTAQMLYDYEKHYMELIKRYRHEIEFIHDLHTTHTQEVKNNPVRHPPLTPPVERHAAHPPWQHHPPVGKHHTITIIVSIDNAVMRDEEAVPLHTAAGTHHPVVRLRAVLQLPPCRVRRLVEAAPINSILRPQEGEKQKVKTKK